MFQSPQTLCCNRKSYPSVNPPLCAALSVLFALNRPLIFVFVQQGKTMGCIKSKENKGPTMKYQPENSPASDCNAATTPHVGYYGPDPTQLQQSQAPSSSGSGAANFNHSITPFGGSSSAMTPFGGTSTSFTGPMSNSFSGAVSSE